MKEDEGVKERGQLVVLVGDRSETTRRQLGLKVVFQWWCSKVGKTDCHVKPAGAYAGPEKLST